MLCIFDLIYRNCLKEKIILKAQILRFLFIFYIKREEIVSIIL